MTAEVYRFRVGSVECLAVNDGTHVYDAGGYFAGVPSEIVAAELRRFGDTPEHIVSPYTNMAIKTVDGWVLVDTGAGKLSPATGHLRERLQAEGIGSDDVALVIITHAHPDHIGGITDGEGHVQYPGARWVMLLDEWRFWTSPAARQFPPIFTQFVEKNLPPIADKVTLFDGETEVAPGVWILPAPGHTPGHAVVAVRSAHDECVYAADSVLHPLHLEHPEWQPIFDMDHERAAESARRVFDRAAEREALVLAFHFPFPSVGHVSRHGTGWRWEPL